jgi:hypothetical protein
MKQSRTLWALALVGAGCVDAQPTSPNFEQRVFSLLGGLEVGEALTLLGENAESIVLQGGRNGAQYVFIPFLAAEQGSVRLRVEIRGEELTTPDLPDSDIAPSPLAQRSVVGTGDDASAHIELREWEHRVTAPLLDGRSRVGRDPAVTARLAERATPVPQVGEIVPLRVPNRDPGNSDLCQNPKLRTARVTAVTPHAILVEDVLNPVALSPSDVQRIGDEYEQLVYPVSVENFGEPTDIDENERVYIFVTSALNETAQPGGSSLTVGFAFALDLVPRASATSTFQCPASNEGEIFYLIAPDPQGVLGVTVSEELVRRLTTSIVVHELQHMINFGRRLYEVEGAQEFEKVWLNEGLSHISEELVFFAATGMRPGSDIDWATLSGSEATFNAYTRFVRDNMSIYADYLEAPDNETLMGKSADDDDFETRGAIWAFLRYLADQIPSDDADLFRALVNSPVGGLANLERALEGDPRTWMQRWTVASYTDNLPATEAVGRFTQPSWNYRSIYEGEIGRFPLAPRALEPDATISLTLRGGGSSYLVLKAKPGRQARVNTTRVGQAIFGELRISVVRVE